MPTGDGSSAVVEGTREVTRLPARGSVLVQSTCPPGVPPGLCVDLRLGPFATFYGDRFRLSLVVRGGGERRRFDRSDLPAVGDAVVALLDDGERAADEPAIVRYGDRAASRRLLPTAAGLAIERRIATAASRGAATLVAWTTATPRPGDHRTYDVVLDGAPTCPE